MPSIFCGSKMGYYLFHQRLKRTVLKLQNFTAEQRDLYSESTRF